MHKDWAGVCDLLNRHNRSRIVSTMGNKFHDDPTTIYCNNDNGFFFVFFFFFFSDHSFDE